MTSLVFVAVLVLAFPASLFALEARQAPTKLAKPADDWKKTRTSDGGESYSTRFCQVHLRGDKNGVMFLATHPSRPDAETGKSRNLDQTIIVELIRGELVIFRGTMEKIEKTWVARGRVSFDLFREGCLALAKRGLPLPVRQLIAERFGNAYELGDSGQALKAP